MHWSRSSGNIGTNPDFTEDIDIRNMTCSASVRVAIFGHLFADNYRGWTNRDSFFANWGRLQFDEKIEAKEKVKIS